MGKTERSRLLDGDGGGSRESRRLVIRRIHLQNFRSFLSGRRRAGGAEGESENETGWSGLIVPDRESGFYLMSGQNLVQPRLAGNATGKSTLWEGLVWAFYGRTSRGQKGPSVAAWDGSVPVSVAVEFRIGRATYTLTRVWSPNTLVLETLSPDGESVETERIDQDRLERLLGIDYAGFIHCVFLSQFGRFFFDLSPTEKLGVFSGILGLDIWERASQEAKSRAKQLESEMTEVTRSLDRLEGARETRRAEIESLRERAQEVGRSVRDRVSRLRQRIDEAGRRQAELDGRIAEARRVLRVMDAQVEDIERAMQRADAERQRLHQGAMAVQAELGMVRAELNQRERERYRIGAHAGNLCPECQQTVPPEHVDRIKRSIDERMRADRLRARRLELESEEWSRLVDAAESEVQALSARLDGCRARKEEAARSLAAATSERSVVDAARRRAEEEIAREERAGDEVASQLDRLRAEYAEMRRQKDGLTSKRDDLARQLDACSYWVGGFKQLRLWLVDGCLRELEVEVNNSLQELGLVGWSITFDVERETASGTIARGFHVLVNSPDAAKEQDEPADLATRAVPWESWSGGETQRLRVAGAIGLANMIRSRTGFDCNLEVWDEPTQHLSDDGVEDLLGLFRDRSRRECRQIWLVDHRSLVYPFDGEYCVLRDELGSRTRKVG